MMKLTSLLHKDTGYSSVSWHASKSVPGVKFAIRKVSLRQRIELNHRVRELALKYEFLNAGDTSNQLEAALSDLLAAQLYIEWGLAAIEGLSINDEKATAESLILDGPANLADEIVQTIQAEIALTADERKNS
jgi:hypothetical protein